MREGGDEGDKYQNREKKFTNFFIIIKLTKINETFDYFYNSRFTERGSSEVWGYVL